MATNFRPVALPTNQWAFKQPNSTLPPQPSMPTSSAVGGSGGLGAGSSAAPAPPTAPMIQPSYSPGQQMLLSGITQSFLPGLFPSFFGAATSQDQSTQNDTSGQGMTAPNLPANGNAATAQYNSSTSMPAAGDINGWRQVIINQLPAQYRGDTGLINTILAGGLAESGLNPTRMQQGGNGVGFWQFDTGGGMGTGVPQGQLTNEAYQASRIIPLYIQYWNQAPDGLSPAEKASWVAAMAERPYDYTNPNSTARQNYAAAYNHVAGIG